MTRTLAALALTLLACSSPAATPPDAPPAPWTIGPTLPGRRLEPGLAAVGTQLYMLGGFDNSLQEGLTITTEVDTLDTTTPGAAWAALPAAQWAPRAWTHVQLAALGTRLYLLGGLEGQEYIAKPDAFVFDTTNPTPGWGSAAPIPATFERGSAAVVVAPPRIYLLGGAGTNAALKTNLYYDTIMDAWCPGPACTADQQIPDLPQPRSHPAGMRMADGTLVVVGGLATLDSSQPAADVWWLPVDQQHTGGQWQTKTPMPLARGGCAYATIGARVICAGGEAGPSALHFAQIYEPALDATPPTAAAWADLPDLPSERAGAPGAAVGQRLYITGGAQELQFIPLDTTLVLDLAIAQGP